MRQILQEKERPSSDKIKAKVLRNELDKYVISLKSEQLQPNTICTYRRIVAYLLLYCEEEKSYHLVTDLVSGDIRDFILYLYNHGYFRLTPITSGLSGLKRFLTFCPETERLIMELPSRLPRERNITEIYDATERAAINRLLSDDSLAKQDRAICLLLLATGLRAVDICNIKLTDIDGIKDIIYVKQQKTGNPLYIPLRKSYGNAIADCILNSRPACKSEYLFVRELVPFTP